ncbi:MAG: leucine-rich repeat protein, partial [Lachnospiraceae bacterium]|nr:leucine-rich repeat protein [Lachnospiraceae bacterium]
MKDSPQGKKCLPPAEKTVYREEKKLLTAQRKKSLPCGEKTDYRVVVNLPYHPQFGGLMCMFLLCMLICTAVLAEGGNCGDGLEWNYDGSTKTLTISYTGTGSGIMTNYGVNEETSPWRDFRGMRSVQINEGVTSIGAYAFYTCFDLTDISIPSSVQSIGEKA